MKDREIKIKLNGISQKQWSVFLLELNIMKRAWKPFGVLVDIDAPNFAKVVRLGTRSPDVNKNKKIRRTS
jgi:hypothetical protein|tara:strand:+ start:460 stop:669 length:210 start_codon:yes stop_codon:yes gene_type:complete